MNIGQFYKSCMNTLLWKFVTYCRLENIVRTGIIYERFVWLVMVVHKVKDHHHNQNSFFTITTFLHCNLHNHTWTSSKGMLQRLNNHTFAHRRDHMYMWWSVSSLTGGLTVKPRQQKSCNRHSNCCLRWWNVKD
jgi:hypothetical protein